MDDIGKIGHCISFSFSKIQINLSTFELKMTATYHRYLLNFKSPSGTSRGVLTTKETWFIVITSHGKTGIGECGLFRGLSVDDRLDYEDKLKWVCNNIDLDLEILLSELVDFPSIQFGLEMAFKSLESQSPFELFPTAFTSGAYLNERQLSWFSSEIFLPAVLRYSVSITPLRLSSGSNVLKNESFNRSWRAQFLILGKNGIEPSTFDLY